MLTPADPTVGTSTRVAHRPRDKSSWEDVFNCPWTRGAGGGDLIPEKCTPGGSNTHQGQQELLQEWRPEPHAAWAAQVRDTEGVRMGKGEHQAHDEDEELG